MVQGQGCRTVERDGDRIIQCEYHKLKDWFVLLPGALSWSEIIIHRKRRWLTFFMTKIYSCSHTTPQHLFFFLTIIVAQSRSTEKTGNRLCFNTLPVLFLFRFYRQFFKRIGIQCCLSFSTRLIEINSVFITCRYIENKNLIQHNRFNSHIWQDDFRFSVTLYKTSSFKGAREKLLGFNQWCLYLLGIFANNCVNHESHTVGVFMRQQSRTTPLSYIVTERSTFSSDLRVRLLSVE